MLGEPQRTPYDVNFRLFEFPVRISPWFWVMTVFLGGSAMRGGIRTLLPWVMAVLVSILIHELGHTFAFRYFGIPSRIALYHFGGLAIPEGYGASWGRRSVDPRAQAMISVAGPLAQIVFGLLVMGIVGISGHGLSGYFGFLEDILPFPDGQLFRLDWLNNFLSDFVWISLIWALFNLLPVYPLDGGQIARSLLYIGGANQPVQTSLMISVVAGGAAALYGLMNGRTYLALMFGALAYSSYQALQGSNYGRRGW